MCFVYLSRSAAQVNGFLPIQADVWKGCVCVGGEGGGGAIDVLREHWDTDPKSKSHVLLMKERLVKRATWCRQMWPNSKPQKHWYDKKACQRTF